MNASHCSDEIPMNETPRNDEVRFNKSQRSDEVPINKINRSNESQCSDDQVPSIENKLEEVVPERTFRLMICLCHHPWHRLL